MAAPKAGPWIAGTVAVSLVVVLAGWFLMISPIVASASETRAQAQAQEDQNALTQVRIAALAEQFGQLDQLKAELAAMRVQIPTSYDLASYQRELSNLAATSSVTLTSVETGLATPFVPVGAAAPAPAPAADEAAAPAAEGEAAAPAATGPVGVEGLYAMTTNLNVVGTYPNVLAFLQSLQTGSQRLFLVESLSGTALDASEASAGRPATSPGDLELAVTGSLYVLTETRAPVVAADPAAAPPVLPVPDPAKNPFAPLG